MDRNFARLLARSATRLAAALALLLLTAFPARAGIDWAGGIWPNDGTVVGFARDLDVWAQVWVDGVTEQVGPAPGIRGVLYYAIDGAALTDSVMMDYVQELGTADEHVGYIPATALDGASKVTAWVTFYDVNDGAAVHACVDQAGNDAPVTYLVDGIDQELTVCFQVCMEATNYTSPVCLSGWSHWLGCWRENIRMTPVGQDIWQVCVVFPRGAERIQEYLYLKDGCSTYESIPSRFIALDESLGEQLVADIWENGPGGCAVVATEASSFGGLKALFDR